MRTTLTLEDDVARALKEHAEHSGTDPEQIANALLRAELDRARPSATRLLPFVVDARPCGFRAGIDTRKLNQLSDEIEAKRVERKGA